MTVFDLTIATIFAREFMEGAIIIGEFRTVIQKADTPLDPNAPTKEQMLRAVNLWALFGFSLAVLVILIVGIPLGVLSHELDDKTSEIIEGVSKIIASFCILQLSLKIPKWMGFYKTKKAGKVSSTFDLSMASIRFNVAWNIWREVAECGVFVLPFFLNKNNLKAIPLSAVVGIILGLAIGFAIYSANSVSKSKTVLVCLVTFVLVLMATGLFTGGCHEFEEVLGDTPRVWYIDGTFWKSSRLPMTLFKPFGYSNSRTRLQIIAFWLFLTMSVCFHVYKYKQTKKIEAELAAGIITEEKINDDSSDDIEHGKASRTTSDRENEEVVKA